MNIGFIGFGLIAGSIAKKLKSIDPDTYITVTSRSKGPLLQAKEDGVIDLIADSIDSSFTACDYIFLCTPVVTITKSLAQVKEVMSPSCILTDVGSVKGFIHKAVHEAGLDSQFIGGHPMAGSDKSGYSYSREDLLKGAVYVITPTYETPMDKLMEFKTIVMELGAFPIIMECQEHDYAVAGISHVPHLASAALATLVHDNDDSAKHMHALAAGGFKDTTRIAASSPEMWEQICVTNKDAIDDLLGKYIDSLNVIREHIRKDDDSHCCEYVRDLFAVAGQYRNTFN